jgi:signal transduction histidine kinase
MKAVGEAALGLPWIVPCASALVSLAKDGPAAWASVRTDPGAVLLVTRAAGPHCSVTTPLTSLVDQPHVLQLAHTLLTRPCHWVDWSSPRAARVYRLALRQAVLAHALAQALPGCDPDKAWIGGLIAPLGSMALAAADERDALLFGAKGTARVEAAAIGRRLARTWMLPSWLSVMVGHLGLSANIAQRLGAEPRLFQVVQLSSALAGRDDSMQPPLLAHDEHALAAALGLGSETVERLRREAKEEAERLLAEGRVWQSPASQPLLADLLQLAIKTRQERDQDLLEHLHRDLDHLQTALEEHHYREKDRLHTLKLAALAELAAGAGHEINNPLAVISGQAQYALKQLTQAEGELVEDAAAVAVLHELRGRVERSFHAILGQVQRIHHVLTDLMQFARPAPPRRQAVRLRDLLKEATQAVAPLAEARKVRLVFAEPPENWHVQVDAAQVRTGLVGLLRNAVEAAPPEGWAGIRAEARAGAVGVVIEDNGQGPSGMALEHMFDPFFSGRSAGRGRGLGLPTAWRLARQHGGDVAYEGLDQGLTRFVMTLPDLEMTDPPPVQGNGHYAETARNGSH